MNTAMRIHTAAVLAGALALAACANLPNFSKTEPARFEPCGDVTVSIYFAPSSAVISKDAAAVLQGAAQQARGCKVDRVDVLGLADPVGSPDANMKLSEKRAEAVSQTLSRYGVTTASVSAAGETAATTEGGAVDPLRRRAEVVLRLSKP